MPGALVEAIEVGVRGALLDDKNTLSKAQQRVEFVYRELLEAVPFRGNLRHAGHDRSFVGTRPFVISCAFPGPTLSLGPRNIVAENPPVLVVAPAATCEPGPQKKLRAV
jgi:hypothetical protein